MKESTNAQPSWGCIYLSKMEGEHRVSRLHTSAPASTRLGGAVGCWGENPQLPLSCGLGRSAWDHREPERQRKGIPFSRIKNR